MSASDRLFRRHYAHVVATLARRFGLGRLAEIEDAVQDAFVAALGQWPYHGEPDNPAGWLVRVAGNRLLDRLRRRTRWEGEDVGDARAGALESSVAPEPHFERELSDDQLRMIFACCHPEVPRDGRVALTLKAVCGLSTDEIARAFLSSR